MKKFRDLKKGDSESHTDFAFKMQNFFKRWLQSLGTYDDIERLRQIMLMEQFLLTVSTELKIWLVDQKPKTVDEMARLADQYVALRKQSSLQQNTSSGNADNVIAHNRSNFKNAAATQRPNNQYSHNANTSPKKFFKPYKSAPTAPRANTVICAYCKKPNHTVSECRKLKQKQAAELAEQKQASTASMNTNVADTSHADKPSVLHVAEAKDTEMSVHPLFAPFCSPVTIIKPDGYHRNIQTLRDTGAMQSLIKGTPGSTDFTDTGETRLLKGIMNDTISVPLVEVHLHTNFINEKVLCGLVSELPDGIDFSLETTFG